MKSIKIKWVIAALCGWYLAFEAKETFFPKLPPVIQNFSTPFSSLSEKQKRLWKSYVSAPLTQTKKPEEWWNGLSPGKRATFASVTKILESIKLRDGKSGLSLIQNISQITGEPPTGLVHQNGAGNTWCSIKLKWNKFAYESLADIHWSFRHGADHPGETGLSFQEGENPMEIHALFEQEQKIDGHLHLDFRKLIEGHLTWYNACVRATGPQTDQKKKAIRNADRFNRWFSEPHLGLVQLDRQYNQAKN